MDNKLTLDPNVIIEAYKAVGDNDMFTQLMVAAAYFTKYRGKLPKKFTYENYPIAYDYFKKRIKPALEGKPAEDSTVDVGPELFNLIDHSNYFDDEERKVLKDMLTMWWGRGKYSRTELIYTQSMALNRTGCPAEKFIELRKWLKANEALDWENRPYNDYLTSYHTFNEKKLVEILKDEDRSIDIS